MDFILPITITDALLIFSSIPETDYGEWATGTTYSIGYRVIVTTPNIHKIYESLTGSNTGNYPPSDTTNWLEIGATNRWTAFDGTLGTQTQGTIASDLLNEDCADISDWADSDFGGSSDVDPAGQFKFDVTGGYAERSRSMTGMPNQFTVEIKTYFDTLGTRTNADDAHFVYNNTTFNFEVIFASDGLFILKTGGYAVELGSNIVKCNASAAWQTWRFQVDKSLGDANAAVEVFLDDLPQGTVDCDYEANAATEKVTFRQQGMHSATLSHVDYIKIASGLGVIDSTVTSFGYVLTPGAIDSVALLNLSATSVRIQLTGTGAASSLITEDSNKLITEDSNQLTDEGSSSDYDVTYDTTNKTDLVVTDLTQDAAATLTITINNTVTTPKVGEIIVGNKTYIGSLQYSPSIGIKDWSTKEVDVYGHYTITERTFSKWMKCALTVLMANLDTLALNLATYRSTPLVWVGSETYSSMILYGYYTDFSIVLSYPAYAICQLEIEGLT